MRATRTKKNPCAQVLWYAPWHAKAMSFPYTHYLKKCSKLDDAKPLLWLGENVAAAGRHLEILMTSFFQRLRWPDIVGT